MKSSNLIIFLSLILASCSSWENWQKNSQPKIRIVDLQGKTHAITTRVPELNAQAMASQGSLQNNAERAASEKKSVQQGEIKYQNYQDQNIANAQATNSFPQSNPAPAETKDTVALGASTKESEQVVEYNLAESEDEKKPEKIDKKSTDKKAVLSNAGDKFFVQVGSFANHAAADSLLKKMKKFHSGRVEAVETDKTIYRVWIGPFSSRVKAKEMMKKITSTGQDAIVTKGK